MVIVFIIDFYSGHGLGSHGYGFYYRLLLWIWAGIPWLWFLLSTFTLGMGRDTINLVFQFVPSVSFGTNVPHKQNMIFTYPTILLD